MSRLGLFLIQETRFAENVYFSCSLYSEFDTTHSWKWWITRSFTDQDPSETNRRHGSQDILLYVERSSLLLFPQEMSEHATKHALEVVPQNSV